MEAKGTFEVKIIPSDVTAIEIKAALGRMTIDKAWNGDLVGYSKGAMMTCATESTGAMAYVALERVEGKLNGKSGTFYFSHSASMNKGDAGSSILKITVVPGSGTDELMGLSGELSLQITNKVHSYVFEYTFE